MYINNDYVWDCSQFNGWKVLVWDCIQYNGCMMCVWDCIQYNGWMVHVWDCSQFNGWVKGVCLGLQSVPQMNGACFVSTTGEWCMFIGWMVHVYDCSQYNGWMVHVYDWLQSVQWVNGACLWLQSVQWVNTQLHTAIFVCIIELGIIYKYYTCLQRPKTHQYKGVAFSVLLSNNYFYATTLKNWTYYFALIWSSFDRTWLKNPWSLYCAAANG